MPSPVLLHGVLAALCFVGGPRRPSRPHRDEFVGESLLLPFRLHLFEIRVDHELTFVVLSECCFGEDAEDLIDQFVVPRDDALQQSGSDLRLRCFCVSQIELVLATPHLRAAGRSTPAYQ